MSTKEKQPLLPDDINDKNAANKSTDSSAKQSFWPVFLIWLWGIVVGFIPLVVNALHSCEVKQQYSWSLLKNEILGSLDVPFSLMTVFYALYLQSEQLPTKQNGFIPVYRGAAIVATGILLLYAIILRYSPVLRDTLNNNNSLVSINLVFLGVTLVWGIIGHVVFVRSK